MDSWMTRMSRGEEENDEKQEVEEEEEKEEGEGGIGKKKMKTQITFAKRMRAFGIAFGKSEREKEGRTEI